MLTLSNIAPTTSESSSSYCGLPFRGFCTMDFCAFQKCYPSWASLCFCMYGSMVSAQTGSTLQSLIIRFTVMWLGKGVILKSDFSWSQWGYFWMYPHPMFGIFVLKDQKNFKCSEFLQEVAVNEQQTQCPNIRASTSVSPNKSSLLALVSRSLPATTNGLCMALIPVLSSSQFCFIY